MFKNYYTVFDSKQKHVCYICLYVIILCFFITPSPHFLYKLFEDIIDHDFYFLCHSLKILVYI